MAGFIGGGGGGPDYVQPGEPANPESPERWFDTDANPNGDGTTEGQMKVYGIDGQWHAINIEDHAKLANVLADSHHPWPVPTAGLAADAVTGAKIAADAVGGSEVTFIPNRAPFVVDPNAVSKGPQVINDDTTETFEPPDGKTITPAVMTTPPDANVVWVSVELISQYWSANASIVVNGTEQPNTPVTVDTDSSIVLSEGPFEVAGSASFDVELKLDDGGVGSTIDLLNKTLTREKQWRDL